MTSFNHLEPSQNSRTKVSKLKPNVPGFGCFGLPAVFQDGILWCPVGSPRPFATLTGGLITREFLCNIGTSPAAEGIAADGTG